MGDQGAEGMIYECVKCGIRSRADKWMYPETVTFKCPNCGYRCARKLGPPIAKRLKRF